MRSRRRDLAGAISRRRDRDRRRNLATARDRAGEIAIDASRDRAVDRDLDPARCREGEIAPARCDFFLDLWLVFSGIWNFFWVWFDLNKSWRDL